MMGISELGKTIFMWKYDPGPRFNIKMSSYQNRKFHCGDKTVVTSSYLHNGIFYTCKISLYWIGGLMVFPRLDIPVRSEKRQLSIIDTILCILYCPNDTICIFFSPWCMSEGHRPVCVQIIWQLRGPNQALSGIGHSRGLLQYPRRYFILWFYCVSKPENWAFQ